MYRAAHHGDEGLAHASRSQAKGFALVEIRQGSVAALAGCPIAMSMSCSAQSFGL